MLKGDYVIIKTSIEDSKLVTSLTGRFETIWQAWSWGHSQRTWNWIPNQSMFGGYWADNFGDCYEIYLDFN